MKRQGKIQPSSLLRITIFICAVACCAAASVFVLGQSGRNRSQEVEDKRPVKPVPLPQIPGPKSGTTKTEAPAEETLSINSNLITVVTSIAAPKDGIPTELRNEDFEVLEDGMPQEIVQFSREQDTPLRLAMLFDVSSSVTQQINFQRRAAAHFFERIMRPQDKASLFAVSTDVTVLQDFTDKVSSLSNATKLLRAKGATSLYDAIYLAADHLKPTQGRRIILIVSDGGDTTSSKSLREALQQAQLSDAVIYAVFTGTNQASQNIRDLAAERALITLTSETGGEVFYPQLGLTANDNDEEKSLKILDEAFSRLAAQLRTQYTLRFYSTNDNRDGQFRKITVRVKKPGYAARARSGYYAPKG
ncbi:MAG TPA: VWA domain-containing protein [Blastocatellia bacterium]|nr:VWA domain-containing protein [Blastocatellia bacterium]